jgi:hypothetical protein
MTDSSRRPGRHRAPGWEPVPRGYRGRLLDPPAPPARPGPELPLPPGAVAELAAAVLLLAAAVILLAAGAWLPAVAFMPAGAALAVHQALRAGEWHLRREQARQAPGVITPPGPEPPPPPAGPGWTYAGELDGGGHLWFAPQHTPPGGGGPQ